MQEALYIRPQAYGFGPKTNWDLGLSDGAVEQASERALSRRRSYISPCLPPSFSLCLTMSGGVRWNGLALAGRARARVWYNVLYNSQSTSPYSEIHRIWPPPTFALAGSPKLSMIF